VVSAHDTSSLSSKKILLKKERVYCPNCGILVRGNFNPEVRTAYLEEVKTYLSEMKAPFIRFFDDGRIKCPMCSAVGRNSIKIENKSKVLYSVSIVPRIATKYVCKKWGYEKFI